MDPTHRDLGEVAAAIRSELRLEAEEAEREAALSAAMRRSLSDVARELMAHGDTVALDVGERTFTGAITGVASDLVTIEAAGTRVDVRLGSLASIRVVKRARTGGMRGAPRDSTGLRARLLELQLSGQEVEAGIAGAAEPVLGPVALVGSDHVAFGEQAAPERFLPFTALVFVRTRAGTAARASGGL
jgi:hypothetical protein